MNCFRTKLDKISNWLMLLPLILGGAWFFVLEKTMLNPTYFMYTKLDDLIPFVPAFVIPYVIWYGYVAGAAIFLFFRSKDAFRRIAIFLSAGMCFACLVYTVLPNGQFLRPYVLGSDWCSQLIAQLYRSDTPFNSAPSIHVIYSMGATYAIMRHNRNASKRRKAILAVLTWSLTVLICLSTVFVKQHSVIDMFTGIAVGLALYALIYRRRPAKAKQKQESAAAV